MENISTSKTVEVHKDVYATPIYEMEVYGMYHDDEGDNGGNLQTDIEKNDEMVCNISSLCVGTYLTKDDAINAYQMILEHSTLKARILAMQIRENPLGCNLKKDSYIKEWSYDNRGHLLDESIIRNYDEEYFPYYGRPDYMTHHKSGDIVQYIDYAGKWLWGIVLGLPPTIEQISEKNKELTEVVTYEVEDGHSFYCWSHDSYLILTGKDDDSVLVPPQNVFKPLTSIPYFVKEALTETYNVESKKNFSYF